MPRFDLKIIDAVKGNQVFYQLTIDDNPDFENLGNGESVNDRKTGILDSFEEGLEKKYRKNLVQIYNTMDRVARNEHVPGEKYHELTGRKENDPHKDYEFKHGDLRVYAIKSDKGKIIIFGGFKNSQPEDIIQMRSLKKQYFESLKHKK